ncbi:MAG: thioesterase family protein, partial [Clostridia bacterium]|nr:thioesterase family protein [Clostridia bacterium]
MSEKTLKTIPKITVDWAYVDAMRHVNTLAILRYIQTARVNICRAAGVMPEFIAPKVGPIVASIEVKFRHPLFFPGEATVESQVTGCRTSSFTLAHRVLDAAGNLIAEESEVMVYYDYEAGRKIPLPEAFIALAQKQ